jgi:heme/copper-type cytochrome/quinol oxidase subunit 4
MCPKPKTASLLILGIISIACSRTAFLLVDDSEGPNLLIVIGLATIIYILILGVYFIYKMYNK